MNIKKINNIGGVVYSTNPNFNTTQDINEIQNKLKPSAQQLKIKLDKKHRGGKVVTLVEGFEGTLKDAEDLGKKLKAYCGTGGAVKNGEIMVQGDSREKVLNWLLKNDYINTKKI